MQFAPTRPNLKRSYNQTPCTPCQPTLIPSPISRIIDELTYSQKN
ncbi:hypothetical protein [Moraxella lacunata]